MSYPHSHAAGCVTDIPAALAALMDQGSVQRCFWLRRAVKPKRFLSMAARAARSCGYAKLDAEFEEDIMSAVF